MLEISKLDEIESITAKNFTEINKFTCSGKELEVLLLVRENNKPAKIIDYIKKNGYDPVSLITSLDSLNLIDVKTRVAKSKNRKTGAEVSQKDSFVDLMQLMSFIEARFLEAVGPIADVILDDAVDDMGEKKKGFSLKRIPELINILSREIPREDKRIEFQKAMIAKLKELKMA